MVNTFIIKRLSASGFPRVVPGSKVVKLSDYVVALLVYMPNNKTETAQASPRYI